MYLTQRNSSARETERRKYDKGLKFPFISGEPFPCEKRQMLFFLNAEFFIPDKNSLKKRTTGPRNTGIYIKIKFDFFFTIV